MQRRSACSRQVALVKGLQVQLRWSLRSRLFGFETLMFWKSAQNLQRLRTKQNKTNQNFLEVTSEVIAGFCEFKIEQSWLDCVDWVWNTTNPTPSAQSWQVGALSWPNLTCTKEGKHAKKWFFRGISQFFACQESYRWKLKWVCICSKVDYHQKNRAERKGGFALEVNL